MAGRWIDGHLLCVTADANNSKQHTWHNTPLRRDHSASTLLLPILCCSVNSLRILQLYSGLLWCLWLCGASSSEEAIWEREIWLKSTLAFNFKDTAYWHGKEIDRKSMPTGILLFFYKINRPYDFLVLETKLCTQKASSESTHTKGGISKTEPVRSCFFSMIFPPSIWCSRYSIDMTINQQESWWQKSA